MTTSAEDVFRFAPHHDIDPSEDQERLNLLAACIANQQRAGFGNYLDVRERKCEMCGASGFNTGRGFWQFACGMTMLSDGEVDNLCPHELGEAP